MPTYKIIHLFCIILADFLSLQCRHLRPTGMSTAKRLVLSLRGRKHSQGNTATSSTRLVSAGTSPGHELDEIAVVSGTGGSSHHLSSYGGIGADISNGPRYSTGESYTSIYVYI